MTGSSGTDGGDGCGPDSVDDGGGRGKDFVEVMATITGVWDYLGRADLNRKGGTEDGDESDLSLSRFKIK